MTDKEKLDRVLELLTRLVEQGAEHRATDVGSRRKRPAADADAVDQLAGEFERIIRVRRLEMLNAGKGRG